MISSFRQTIGNSRLVGAVLFGLAGLGSCCAQTGSLVPTRNRSLPQDTIDTNTRWAFRAISPVTVNTPIVRLGDVARPLDPNLAAWQRLRRAPIGLMPINGAPMIIDRNRLSQAIAEAEATPQWIDWIGPTRIRVEYQAVEQTTKHHDSMTAPAGDVRQVSYFAQPDQQRAAPSAESAPLDTDLARQITYWIQLALKRQQETIVEAYTIDIDPAQAALRQLESVRGIEQVRFVGSTKEGSCPLYVLGRSTAGRVEAEIVARLTANPVVVVAKNSLPRGHRFEPSDLTTKAVTQADFDPSFFTDPQELVGLEVRGSVRGKYPIARGDVGSPILVRRGDLLEIRVVGGGISVSTNARALEEGAEADLVEVETLSPRKKLVARVVRPGLVEIITRAPRVRP